ncbi:hypothetical protein [Arthrobacter roseus]|uniref:hypothetical protein n=1 Tax=Arthrobacter roseus TaxID=136274 RepID=UPI001965649E|nr:hypothetical protein [Arthrobacter roseus]MBM7847450.1 hypothetical protein [Arthrobacter roseus]
MEIAAIITAIGGALTVVGAGLGFLIKRADTKRKDRETALLEHMKARIAALEAETRRLRADATAWREQLIANDINPVPTHWTEGAL